MALVAVLVTRKVTSTTEQRVEIDTDEMATQGFRRGDFRGYVAAGLGNEYEERTTDSEDRITEVAQVR